MITEENGLLNVHPLVQEVTQLNIKQQRIEKETFTTVCELVETYFKKLMQSQDYFKLKIILPHSEKLLQEIKNWFVKNPSQQKHIEQQSIKNLLIQMSDHYDIARTLVNLGNAYGDLRQHEKQKTLLERALLILEKHYGPDHYEVAITLMSLGKAYGDLGQPEKQKTLLERALPTLEKHYGPDHYEVARTLVNLGHAYGGIGQPEKQKTYYECAIHLLLRVLQVFSDQMTQCIVICLLNSLSVDGHQNITVGNSGAIEVILEVISRRADAAICDEVMEVSWSFLWNITDETPINCNKFLYNHGMKLFQKCKEKFPDRTELLHNMMGLMGNIAEVKELRFHLMQSCFVSVFCELLNNTTEGIEISYNSACVLAHMISDGDEVWTFNQPTREEASVCVVRAIQTWQLNAKRFINYRSFEPIFRLLPLENSYASTYWAVWELANLTTVDGPKYCGFIIDEKGVPLLQDILLNPKMDSMLQELARKVLQNVQENKGVLVV